MKGLMNCLNEKGKGGGGREREGQEKGRESVIEDEWVLVFDLVFSLFLFV